MSSHICLISFSVWMTGEKGWWMLCDNGITSLEWSSGVGLLKVLLQYGHERTVLPTLKHHVCVSANRPADNSEDGEKILCMSMCSSGSLIFSMRKRREADQSERRGSVPKKFVWREQGSFFLFFFFPKMLERQDFYRNKVFLFSLPCACFEICVGYGSPEILLVFVLCILWVFCICVTYLECFVLVVDFSVVYISDGSTQWPISLTLSLSVYLSVCLSLSLFHCEWVYVCADSPTGWYEVIHFHLFN